MVRTLPPPHPPKKSHVLRVSIEISIPRHPKINKKTVTPHLQGSKIAPVRSYLRVPQAAGQVKILLFLVKIKTFPIYANNFCDAGQVPILRYFEA